MFVTLYGPVEKLDSALEAVQKAGIYAEKEPDRGPNCLATWFHSGDENPGEDFISSCVDRTRQAAAGTGFTVDEPGVWCSNAATRKYPYNRHTGEFLGSFIDVGLSPSFVHETLEHIANSYGIDPNDIELRDPPEFDVPLP